MNSFLMKFVWYLKSYLLRSSKILMASTLHSPSHTNLNDVRLSMKKYQCLQDRLSSPVENQNDLELDFKVFFFVDSCC